MNIEVNAGSFSYAKGRPVLTDVSFAADAGEVAAILGANGVGKTTFLRCLLGFLPWDAGETLVFGKNIRRIPDKKLFQEIAYVPQARQQVFSCQVSEMVLLGRSPYLGTFQVPGRKDREIAAEAMELAGIEKLAGKNCAQISGGELQLVLIARALAAKPKIMVLDEPESGLDFRNQVVVLELVKRLAREQGMTVILNTHYPDHALRIADRSLILFGSGMHIFGRTSQVLTKPHLRMAFGVDIEFGEVRRDGRVYESVIPLEVADRDGFADIV